MPEIQIRPANSSDIPALIAIDHNYASDQVWQLDFNHDRETGQVSVNFRQVRLPRSVRVKYPHAPQSLADNWDQRAGLLVALLEEQPTGYISLAVSASTQTAWVTDLVVDRPARRKGIGSTLVLAAREWAANLGHQYIVLEMQTRNYPAIQMAIKLGFEFSGYNEHHYPNREIGIFFASPL